jgi:hypothetical protein
MSLPSVLRRRRGAVLSVVAGAALSGGVFVAAERLTPQEPSSPLAIGGVHGADGHLPAPVGRTSSDRPADERGRAHRSKLRLRVRHDSKAVFVRVPALTAESAPAPSPQGSTPVAAPAAHATPQLPGAAIASDAVGAPATVAGREAGVASVASVASVADEGPSPAQPEAQAAATQPKMRLQVRSIEQSQTPGGDPQLAVGLDLARNADEAPEHVTLRLRPTVPDSGTADPRARALRANVDVVDAAPTDAAAPEQQPLAMRVRMAVVDSDATATTVSDRGEGEGHSNVVELTAPLTTFTDGADTAPSPAPGSDDAPPASSVGPAPASGSDPATSSPSPAEPAPDVPAAVEPAAQPPAAIAADAEVLLPLGGSESMPATETAALPVPGTPHTPEEAVIVGVSLVAPLPAPVAADPPPAGDSETPVPSDLTLPVDPAPAPVGDAPAATAEPVVTP